METKDWKQFKVDPKQGERPYPNFAVGSSRSMCVECWEIFSSDIPFQMHRKGTGMDRYCVTPESAGLVRRANGDWIRDQPAPNLNK